MKEDKIHLVKLWLLFLNFGIIIAYGLILFFTNWEILRYAGMKVALGIGIINIIGHFIMNTVFEKKPQQALELSVYANALYGIIVIDYLGGPNSFLFSIVYAVIFFSFYYKKLTGFLAFGASLLYILIRVGFNGPDIVVSTTLFFPALISLLITTVAAYFLSENIEDLRNKNEKLDTMAEKLSSEKSQDEAVLTAIADGVYAVDMNRNLVLLNKAAQEMTNWDEKEAIGLKCQTVMKLKKEDDTSVCEKDCPALAVWNTGKSVFRNDTCFVNKKSKKRIQLSTSYAPIFDYEGKMAGAICVFRDITKEKEVERLRNEFVSTASHELRTPITATEGYLSIVTDSGIVKIDEKGKEYIGKAKSTLLGMSKLIQNLLAVTKIEEGRVETNITSFSIKDLTKEVIDVFAKRAKEKGITLTFEESKNLTLKGKKAIGRSLNARADMEMIREVLNNLIENAIKFTVKGGVTVSIDYDEEFATVNIEDTGMGIPGEGQKHLFEKFYRVDNTATREVGGTGLGLYITRSIVELFGGRIWVESSAGKGSKFHFTVPLALD